MQPCEYMNNLTPLTTNTLFDNRVLRTTVVPKRKEIQGEWRKLNNEELHDLYSSPTIVRVIKWRK
jgi:hypothetical protein